MNLVPVKKFSPFIVPLAEGCPDFVVAQAVTATVSDICKATGCITTRTCFTTQEGESEYDLRLSVGLNAELVRSVYCDGNKVEPIRIDELDHLFGSTDWREVVGVPRYYTFMKPGTLVLTPTPDQVMFVTVMLTCSVGRSTETVPEIFFEDYLDTVKNGALARIYQIQGQTYTNVRLAEVYQVKYEAGLEDIRLDVSRDFTRGAGRVFYNRIV